MQVIDEISGKPIDIDFAVRAVVKHIPGFIIFGWCSSNIEFKTFYTFMDGELVSFKGAYELIKDSLIYSNYRGLYLSKVDLSEATVLKELYTKGSGDFPYHFPRKYEAVDNFNIFNGRQQILDTSINYEISNHLKYTLGLEFETSQGYIPEDICFRDGLIPLRDGSISGLEYSTVILQGNSGIQLLKQQLDTLNKFTLFNKECSLHVHLGGFPPDKLFNLYQTCYNIEHELSSILPYYTFKSSQYKENGKDYCKKLPFFSSFEQMYETLVGRRFFGSFTQSHPADIQRNRKWQVQSRYYWLNVINALCYKVNKTVEFRFLRPTYNFNKIILWLYIFNAILYVSETSETIMSSLNKIIDRTYPKELAKEIKLGIVKLKILTESQYRNGDLIGRDIEMEKELW